MVSLSCGKINDTVEPLLILQENFMKLLKKAFAFTFIFMLSVSGLTGYQVNASEEQNIWISSSPMICILI